VLIAVVGGVLLAGIPVAAHHSFAAEYFEDQSISIEGEIVEFQYRNPHAWVHVMVVDAGGERVRYSAEWGGAGRLGRSGVTADTLKPGDWVRISGSPGRVATERLMHLKHIERPADGWQWASARRGRR
jgi:hypothetical protein